MELKDLFEDWAEFTDGKFSDRQWLLAKWEVSEGVAWPAEKIAVMLRTINNGLDLCSDHDLVDLGCGGGWILNMLSSRARSGIGLDFSGNMLKNACGLIPRERLVQGSIGRLPFKPGSFDRALCYFVLINMTDDRDVERSILDMARVVKKGGRLLIGQLPDKAGSADYDRAKVEYLDFCRQHYNLGESFRDKNRIPQKLFDVPILKAFLERHGLRYEIRPSFNPFFRVGSPETVSWRFDLVIHKD